MPARIDRRDGGAGLFRNPDSRGIWRPGPRRLRVLPRGGRARARLDERRQHDRARQRPDRIAQIDDAGAEGSLSAAHGAGRFPRRLRALGTQCGFGCRQYFLPRETRRRRMGDHRQQVLVHLRGRRRLHPRLRPHRSDHRSQGPPPRHLGLHGREAARQAARGRLGQSDPEDRLLRLDHLGTRLRPMPRARRKHYRRGRPGLLSRDRRSRDRARPHGGTLHRSRAGRTRRRHPVLQGASPVRKSQSHHSRRFDSRSPRWRRRSRLRGR